jgi:prepilin-type processing-associated H-X9-DG protein
MQRLTGDYHGPSGRRGLAGNGVGDVSEARACAFGSRHPTGATTAFADGSGRFLGDSRPLSTLDA